MRKAVDLFLFVFVGLHCNAQEAFTITHYGINLKVNKNASLDITENLDVHFSQPRHGIIRSIPYQYPMQKLPAGVDQAERQMHANGYTRIFVENIKVPGYDFSVSKSGDYENIK